MLKPRRLFERFEVIVIKDLTGRGLEQKRGVFIGLYNPQGNLIPDHVDPKSDEGKDYKPTILVDERYYLRGGTQCIWKRV
jgi:hypothetical protein